MGSAQALCGERSKCGGQCSQLTISQSLESIIEEPEPSGAVFPDTLEGLNVIDRNLLQFCASTNLAGVRWLLVLGANRRVTDQKGTTCLHAACRSGSCSIVEVLVLLDEEPQPGQPGPGATGPAARPFRMDPSEKGQGQETDVIHGEEEKERDGTNCSGGNSGLQSTDEAGWTPLHVAAFMGRQDVVRVLLRNGANTLARSNKGQFAVDLCSDVSTRRLLQKEMKATSDMAMGLDFLDDRAFSQANQELTGTLQSLQVEGTVLSRSVASPSREIRFEPFFVPRAPLLVEEDIELELAELFAYLGCQIFESSPGRGLAFLVVTGSVRDYPIDLVGFMRTTNLSHLQIGTFLGEDFSLSKILRMEFLNSVCLTSTGVVSALRTGLTGLKVPPDLQKMNRLLGSLSEVWWRQQLRAAKLSKKKDKPDKAGSPSKSQDELIEESIDMAMDVVSDELRGTNLKAMLPSISSLHQLFFSTVMLHWNLHAPLPPSQKLDFDAWAALNRSGTKEDIPDWVLEPIYRAVSRAPVEELSLDLDNETKPVTSAGNFNLSELAVASATGWVQVFADGLPALPGVPRFRAVSFVDARLQEAASIGAPDVQERCGNCRVSGWLCREHLLCWSCRFSGSPQL
ncbi:ARFGEF1 [Symbiodinium sp. CCMP2592]|nr:ARFGEF1 [Symbiodinium sp. CCMP2592]